MLSSTSIVADITSNLAPIVLKVRKIFYIVKPLNSGHLCVLKNLPIIERRPLLRGNFKKIVTFGT